MMIGSACIPSSCGGRCSSYRPRAGVFERPRRRAAEQRYELPASHCPMPPVLPTERIAHLGTVDCCIHPPARYETIAVTPPIISSKEVAQKQATPFPRQDLSPPEIVSDQISGDG